MNKKITSFILLCSMLPVTSHAYVQKHLDAANFLASKTIINNNSTSPSDYNLDYNITRREMLKVMMNLSGKTVEDSCTGAFSDISSNDWGCKYAEAALASGFIAGNSTFRPNDNITQIEALKMIMQAKGLERNEASDWRAGYVSKAFETDLIDENYVDYDKSALRSWIFLTGANSFSDFSYTESTINLDDEIEEIFKDLFDL